MRDTTITKEAEKLSKEEKRYLNSKARAVKRFGFSIIEYIIIILVMMAISTYMQYKTFDNFFENLKSLAEWLRPGGMLFNAIVGFLPIIVVGCVGVYFGEGTFGKMAFGMAKCVAIIIWLMLIFQGASASLDLPAVLSTMNVGGVALDGLVIGTGGLMKFLILIFVCSLLVPIGEFCGARKKHKRALEHKYRLDEDKDF